jgi:hypothetical protein
MPQYLVIPANSVLAEGNPHIVEMEIGANCASAGAKMIAGRCVIHDATDGDVKEAGADAANFMGVLMEQPDELEATAYAIGDQAKVITGGPCIVKCLFASAATGCAPGDKIGCAADGKVKAYSAGSCVGKAMITVASGGPDAEVLVNMDSQS